MNGLEARKAATTRTPDTASRRHCFQPATTRGTSRKTPGYLKPIARPIATPASSRRPDTSRASDAPMPSVKGTSVTAACEYATWIVHTPTAAAPARMAASAVRRPPHRVSPQRSIASAGLDLGWDVTDELGDVSRSDNDRIDSCPLELVQLFPARLAHVCDGELAGRDVGQELQGLAQRV